MIITLIKCLLTAVSIFRLKNPIHFYQEPVPSASKLDWSIRSFLILLAALQFYSHSSWWVPLTLLAIPTYPWFLVLQALNLSFFTIPLTLLSVYGLLQPPWSQSTVYQLHIPVLILTSLYITLFT